MVQSAQIVTKEAAMAAKVKTRESVEHAYVKRTLRKLLSAKGSCIHVLDGRGEAPLDTNGPQHPAIKALIANAKPAWQKGLASYATTKYLDRFDAEKHRFMGAIDVLDYAVNIGTAFPLSRPVAGRLVNRIAEAGWYGRLEAIALKLCKREPTTQEIILLVDNFVKDGNEGTYADRDLPNLLRRYLPREEVERQLARVEKRIQYLRDLP